MPEPDAMTWIPGGTFRMGSDLAGYPEEGPPGAAPDDASEGDDSAVRERSRTGGEPPGSDDDKATGNPNT